MARVFGLTRHGGEDLPLYGSTTMLHEGTLAWISPNRRCLRQTRHDPHHA